jgi:hypothetical protein
VTGDQAAHSGFRIKDARVRLAEGIGPAAASGRISIRDRVDLRSQVQVCTGAALRGRQPVGGIMVLS